MIVDKMSDLNIYKERNKDVERSSCCGTANTEGVAKVASAASCCSSSDSQKADETEAAKRVENIDFNELVSKYNLTPPLFTSTLILMVRFLQHLCCQTW